MSDLYLSLPLSTHMQYTIIFTAVNMTIFRFRFYRVLTTFFRKTTVILYEPLREKTGFCICENKDADQLRGKISAFVFATRIVESLYFLNPKFQAPSHLLWLYRPVCIGPVRKPRRPVFSQRGSIIKIGFYGISITLAW